MRVIFLLGFACLAAADFSCKDMNNQDVDWFVFYKLPRLYYNNNNDSHIANGTGFLYLDSNNKQWHTVNVGMESDEQAIGYTLQQYYDNVVGQKMFSIMYNDEFPDGDVWSADSGHLKGVTAFSGAGGNGFWLKHSIPKFPSNASYVYPSNAHHYGQTGICVSMPYSALGSVATALFTMRPFIYQHSLPVAVSTDYPILTQVVNNQFETTSKAIKYPITSLGGQQFYHFAKSGAWNKDLYFDLLAPSLSSSLNVETWQHQPGNLGSHCDTAYSVYDSKYINLPFGIHFSNYDDHSKYAVSAELTGRWVCIADINRQQHQLVRGGGAMCVRDVLFPAYKLINQEVNQCRN